LRIANRSNLIEYFLSKRKKLLLKVKKGYSDHSPSGQYPMRTAAVQTKSRNGQADQFFPKNTAIGGALDELMADCYIMRHLALFIILSLGASLAVRGEDQGPVEKTGKTVEKAATKTGQTVEHGAQATERTVGKGLKKTGNTLEKAGGAVTGSSKHHAKKKSSAAKASPSPSPKPESSPAASPAATPVESTPTPAPTPVESTPVPTPTPSR
jgi:hypothetical protein